MQSHPTWVRGLKFVRQVETGAVRKSHPTWVRGLKSLVCDRDSGRLYVAPHVGAWIEMRCPRPTSGKG